MGMISFFVMFFLFGVLAQMTVLQDLEHYIADKARRYKQVKVQIHHIGNIDLDIRNILFCEAQMEQKKPNSKT